MVIIKNCSNNLSGTTEKIFEEKTGLLDIYVDNQNIRIPGSIRHLLTITAQDRKRLAQLQCIARSSRNSVEEFINYFSQLNNKIFSTLYMISQNDDNVLKRHHIESMGLHPQHDRAFVSELALTHGFDIVTRKSSWKCCPCNYWLRYQVGYNYNAIWFGEALDFTFKLRCSIIRTLILDKFYK